MVLPHAALHLGNLLFQTYVVPVVAPVAAAAVAAVGGPVVAVGGLAALAVGAVMISDAVDEHNENKKERKN